MSPELPTKIMDRTRPRSRNTNTCVQEAVVHLHLVQHCSNSTGGVDSPNPATLCQHEQVDDMLAPAARHQDIAAFEVFFALYVDDLDVRHSTKRADHSARLSLIAIPGFGDDADAVGWSARPHAAVHRESPVRLLGSHFRNGALRCQWDHGASTNCRSCDVFLVSFDALVTLGSNRFGEVMSTRRRRS